MQYFLSELIKTMNSNIWALEPALHVCRANQFLDFHFKNIPKHLQWPISSSTLSPFDWVPRSSENAELLSMEFSSMSLSLIWKIFTCWVLLILLCFVEVITTSELFFHQQLSEGPNPNECKISQRQKADKVIYWSTKQSAASIVALMFSRTFTVRSSLETGISRSAEPRTVWKIHH